MLLNTPKKNFRKDFWKGNMNSIRTGRLLSRNTINNFRCMSSQLGDLGSGAGKGGGGGGSIREAGGAFGKTEAAREEEYFYKKQKQQIAELKDHIHDEISFHEEQIKRHQDAIARHKEGVKKLEK